MKPLKELSEDFGKVQEKARDAIKRFDNTMNELPDGKITALNQRYEHLKQCVEYLPTVGDKFQLSFMRSIQNEIHALYIEHIKALEKLEKYKKPYVKLLPCICGHNRRERWSSDNGEHWLLCSKCGVIGYRAPNASAARTAWNAMILDLRGILNPLKERLNVEKEADK